MGVGKITSVATSPVSETSISEGFKVTAFPILVSVGIPNSIVLISTSIASSPDALLAKNKSTFVNNTPFLSFAGLYEFGASIFPPTVKDCANGSLLTTLVIVVVIRFCICLVTLIPVAVNVALPFEPSLLPGNGFLFSELLVIV